MNRGKAWSLALVAALGASLAAGANPLDLLRKISLLSPTFDPAAFNKEFHKSFYDGGRLPETVSLAGQPLRPEYTIKPELEEAVLQVMRKYRPDFTSVVLMDNNTGKILAAVDMARESTAPGRVSTFSPTHPAASIFKIVTAADLLENSHVGNDTQFQFSGRSTTLYKSQLKQAGANRWSRRTDFEHAFARSNNVIFGRAALENLSPGGLKRMAEKFGFNKPVVPFLQAPSVFPLAVDQYNLAELASGFNRKTLISPVHGAMIASVVANGGVMRSPSVVQRVRDPAGNVVWEGAPAEEMVVAPETAADLRRMMMATVSEGTARRSFTRLPKSLGDLEIAGKTGSITGGEPFGKRDWFVVYAKDPKRPEDRGVSLCVMIVNKRRWYVKSTRLAREILELIWGPSKLSMNLRRILWTKTT